MTLYFEDHKTKEYIYAIHDQYHVPEVGSIVRLSMYNQNPEIWDIEESDELYEVTGWKFHYYTEYPYTDSITGVKNICEVTIFVKPK